MPSLPHDSHGELGTSRFAEVNGVRLHYVEAGEGPLVVLLHGFPQFWYAWRHQLPAVARAGYRVVALDMRGYNRSDKPRGVRRYDVDALAADVAALVEGLDSRGAALVGHDWGGAVAWHAAERHPAAVRRLVILNAPRPATFARELRTPSQLLRSSYILFFQLPWIPELMVRARNFALVERVLRRDPVRPHAFTDEDVRRHKEALAQPGALTAAINYYRAAVRRPWGVLEPRSEARIEQPTLVIWGDRDRYLRRQLTEGLGRWVPDLRVEHVANASHWVMDDAPERVNELVIRFLAGRG